MKNSAVCIISAVMLCFGCGKSENKVPVSASQVEKSNTRADPHKYPDMVYIPPGEFIMGTDPAKEHEYPPSFGFINNPYASETPRRKVYLDGFYIDRYEVTIGQYAEFAKATGTPLPEPVQDVDVEKYKNYPISCVTWREAADYAEWAGKKLPTEAQWEKAARGEDGRRYPWGNEFSASKANFSKKGFFPVGTYKDDVSPYGVYGMAGSVNEWVSGWYLPYPGSKSDDEAYGLTSKVYRGGSWGGTTGHLELFEYFSRTTYRGYEEPDVVSDMRGLRCVRSE